MMAYLPMLGAHSLFALNEMRSELMPRFYFHVIDGKILIDGEGTELPDEDAARFEAVAIASSLLKGSVKAWPLDPGWQVIIADASRTVIATLAFSVKVPARSPG